MSRPSNPTGAAKEAKFTVVAPSKQQAHYRQNFDRGGAVRYGSSESCSMGNEPLFSPERTSRFSVQKERERREQQKAKEAETEERRKRAWEKERLAVAAKQAAIKQQKEQVEKRKAQAAEQNAPFTERGNTGVAKLTVADAPDEWPALPARGKGK